MDAETEALFEIDPPFVDEDAETCRWVRPKKPVPVEWIDRQTSERSERASEASRGGGGTEPPVTARRAHRSQPSNPTIELTRPALRYLVGMPVMPELARRAPAPAVKPARRSAARTVGRVALLAGAAISLLGACAFALGAASARIAANGDVVVTAYGAGGLPKSGFRVIADGAAQCTTSPCSFTLDPGEHFVTVVAPGYESPHARKVLVAAGRESNLHFELLPSAN